MFWTVLCNPSGPPLRSDVPAKKAQDLNFTQFGFLRLTQLAPNVGADSHFAASLECRETLENKMDKPSVIYYLFL